MPVSFKVVDNRTNVSKKIKDLQDKLKDYRSYFLEEMAADIILMSPVDTGTYITSHSISTTITSGSTSSKGKPKKQDYGMYADIGFNNLLADIASLSDTDLTSIRMTNISEHASVVEYELGHAPYTTVRSRMNILSDNAARKAGF